MAGEHERLGEPLVAFGSISGAQQSIDENYLLSKGKQHVVGKHSVDQYQPISICFSEVSSQLEEECSIPYNSSYHRFVNAERDIQLKVTKKLLSGRFADFLQSMNRARNSDLKDKVWLEHVVKPWNTATYRCFNSLLERTMRHLSSDSTKKWFKSIPTWRMTSAPNLSLNDITIYCGGKRPTDIVQSNSPTNVQSPESKRTGLHLDNDHPADDGDLEVVRQQTRGHGGMTDHLRLWSSDDDLAGCPIHCLENDRVQDIE
ncbi:hypothetical protein B0O80DRAFT_534235 [Mortierella sp. GBAus27b]|nr:hypothetical protein B0O80DRAFT_534235 [Mortierella sp. GBAus27b]